MKNIFTVILCNMVFIATAMELSPALIRDFPKATEQELIYGNGFEPPQEPGMRLGEGFKIVRNEGNNGNTGLRVDRVAPLNNAQVAVFQLPEKFQPGVKYTIKISVRSNNLKYHGSKEDNNFYFMSINRKDLKTGQNRSWRHSSLFRNPPPTNDNFQEFEYSFLGVEDTHPELVLRLPPQYSGTLWFDDLRIYSEGFDGAILLTWPPQHTFHCNDGKYKLKVDAPSSLKKTGVLISLEKDGKVLGESTALTDSNGEIRGVLGKDLPVGKAVMKITLADLTTRQQLKQTEFPVYIHQVEKPPIGTALYDEHGRLIVDGKPFFPLGIFADFAGNENREPAYREITAAGFNFIIDYSMVYHSPGNSDRKAVIRAGLDEYQKHNLKVLFSLLLPLGKPHALPSLCKSYGSDNPDILGARIVEHLRDHPAILGWYMNDEFPEEKLPQAIRHRQLVNSLDPWHPTLALTNLPSSLPEYALSGDIFSPDCYPLNKTTGSKKITDISVAMQAANRSGVPVWGTPQAFNWGIFSAKNPQDYQQYIMPNESDMRAMALLFLAEGAKGLMLYEYPFERRQKKMTELSGDADSPARLWQDIKKMALSLRELESYILSLRKPPEFILENHGSGTVKAIAYQNENGGNCLIIVSRGDGQADAIITIPGVSKMKSKYGNTQNLGEGKYKFSAAGLDSDILFD